MPPLAPGPLQKRKLLCPSARKCKSHAWNQPGCQDPFFNARRRREVRLPLPEWQIDAAVLKLHARRCTCLQFHPSSDNLVISGDKAGQVCKLAAASCPEAAPGIL